MLGSRSAVWLTGKKAAEQQVSSQLLGSSKATYIQSEPETVLLPQTATSEDASFHLKINGTRKKKFTGLNKVILIKILQK